MRFTIKPYRGRILWVDLTHRTFSFEVLPEKIYRQFLSGSGLAAYILYRDLPPQVDPLGPANILGFVSGLLTGTGTLFTGRWLAVARSPLTGTWGESNCGGYFSPAIKQCGVDAIFFTGAGANPVYFLYDHSGPQLMDAPDLWGMDTLESEQALLDRHTAPRRPAVACIGPAGEQCSLLAGISHDQGRLAARAGLGAVMGSKNLKAVVLAGAYPLGCKNPALVRSLSKKTARYYRTDIPLPRAGILPHLGRLVRHLPFAFPIDGLFQIHVFRKWGTLGTYQWAVEWGDAPVRNWSGTNIDYPVAISDDLDPDRLLAMEESKYACYSCPLSCGGICRFGPEGRETHKPEYETLASFGSLQLGTDRETIFEIHHRLICAGMDSISAGAAVAFATECFQQGILTLEDTGGLELRWGDSHAALALIEQMITRQGLGACLADGVRLAAQKIGRGTSFVAIHAGGQESAFHDPRLDPGYALHASVEPAPGRHTAGAQLYYAMYRLWTRLPDLRPPPLISSKRKGFLSDPKSARQAVAISCFTQLYNATGLCFFGAMLGVDRLRFFESLNAALGWEFPPQEYIQIGRRIQTLRQMFNLRMGIDPLSTRLSDRLLGLPPLARGANRGRTVELDAMRRDYYQAIGWDPATGIPTPETIASLNLPPLELPQEEPPS